MPGFVGMVAQHELAQAANLQDRPLIGFRRKGRLRKLVLVNDPDEIEHVLVGNAANYRKSVQQQRRLRPALGDGLLTAEGAAWQGARRVAAPLFSPAAVPLLSDHMLEAAAVLR